MMTKQEVTNWALRHGYTLDSYGNLLKEVPALYQLDTPEVEHLRLKLNPTSVRKEIRMAFPTGQGDTITYEWKRLRSAYYKELSLSPEDKLIGLRIQRKGKE